jgi:hypothetical protein
VLRALSSEQGRRLAVWALFATAALASILLVGLAGRGQTLKSDEWFYAYRLVEWPLHSAVFEPPPGKYLLALPILGYKAAFSTIGIESYLPYRLASLALAVAAASLFLVLAARRVGYIVALPASVLLLFLGSASEVTATPLRIPELVAIVAGLGMLLALERRDLTGDLCASGLALVSVTSHPTGAAFLVAAAVLVLARPAPERWQRIWVFLAPTILFAAWWLTLRTPDPADAPLAEQLRSVPRFEIQSLSAMAAAATGVFKSPFSEGTDFLTPLSYALGGAVIVAVGLRAFATRLPASFWAIVAAMLVLFAAPAFAPGGVPRIPYASRYVYPGVLMLLLLLFEVGRDVRLRRGLAYVAAAIAAILFAYSMFMNTSELKDRAEHWGGLGNQTKAELAALDLARDTVQPTFLAEDPAGQPPIPRTHMGANAEQYFRIADAYGSPAYSPARLPSVHASVGRTADIVLARALALELEPLRSLPRRASDRPDVLSPGASVRSSARGCVRVTPDSGPAPSQVALPRGGVALETTRREPLTLALARFSDGYAFPLKPPPPHKPALLSIPSDASPAPWRLLIGPARQPILVCGVPGTAEAARADLSRAP